MTSLKALPTSQPTLAHLVDDLRAIARKIQPNHLTLRKYKKLGKYGRRVIDRLCGNWNTALGYAQLPINNHYRIPNDQLMENILQLWRALQRKPTLKDLEGPFSWFTRQPYKHRFGGWLRSMDIFYEWAKQQPDANLITGENPVPVPKSNARPVNWRMRHLIMKRDNFRCVACGASPANDLKIVLHIDHIVPTSLGGTSDEENLQTLCERCNIGKGNLME